jgi:hypothetical protein
MQLDIDSVFKQTPALALLVFILWSGHKGWWVWGHNIREIMTRLEKEKNEWRDLALELMKKDKIIRSEAEITSVKEAKEKINHG